jgi:hypothetical protein
LALSDHWRANTVNQLLVIVMRIAGSAFFILGLMIVFSIDDWEAVDVVPAFIGTLPMGIGVVLLAIAKKPVPPPSAKVAAFKAQMDKQTQKQLPSARETRLSPEVQQLFERLQQNFKRD